MQDMGANTSALLSEEIEEIALESNLTQSEIKRLYKRFQKLDRNHTGILEPDELTMIPELAMNPLVPRIMTLFDNVNFRQFVNILSVFAAKGSREEKLALAFRVYDVDDDGFISSDDLFVVLKMMVGDNIEEERLMEITKRVIKDTDGDGDGMISRNEFNEALDVGDIASRMTISL